MLTEVDLRALLPRHRSDEERANAIITLGYPAVAPVLRELLAWLKDGNWPISQPIARFLASIGSPIVPLIQEVFQSDDDIWKYWCIERVVMNFPKNVASQMRPDLQRLAYHPSIQESEQEVNRQAKTALEWLDETEGR
jgi:hypothetical protein